MTARRTVLVTALSAGLAATVASSPARAGDKAHKVVFQVSDADPAKWNLALNNVRNVQHDLGLDNVQIEIVAYGPGLHMLRADTSPVQDRIKQLKGIAFPSKVQFSACGNTKENMEKKEGHSVAVLSDATLVPSGVVQLMEKQEKGWSYVRP